MRKWVGVVTLLAGLGLAGGTLAQEAHEAAATAAGAQAAPEGGGNAEAGATKAAVCLACHGMNGNSTNAEWPSLAGQHATYTAEQLHFFRSGKRNDPVMQPMAAGLSDQDIDDLAAYYAAQTPTGLEAEPSFWEAGQKLYRGGNPESNVPACIACHGPLGRGNWPARYPVVQAQHAVYAQKQLKDYATGQRPGEHAKIMEAIAKRMTPEEIRAVSSYMQGIR
jgi:cytochrome c553